MVTTQSPPRFSLFRRLLPTLIGNAGLPYLVYLVAHGLGVADVPALALSAVPSLVLVLFGVLRDRRIDGIGVLALITIALGIGTSFLTGDARFAVLKGSFLTLGVGLAMLGSLLAAKPLLYHLVRSLLAGDIALRTNLERVWDETPGFRTVLRRYTVLWAGGLLLVVAVHVVLVFSLPIGASLPLLQVVEPVVWLVLVFFTRRAFRPWLRPVMRPAAAAPQPVVSP